MGVLQMDCQFTDDKLEKRTSDELRAMLADDTLLPLDDDSNTDAIIRIMGVINARECKTDRQREEERIAFWTGLIKRGGKRMPIRLEYAVDRHKRAEFELKSESLRKRGANLPRRAARHLAVAAVLVVALLVGSAFVALRLRLILACCKRL
jgi:hypothetical protein